jgi:hypothetical protein
VIAVAFVRARTMHPGFRVPELGVHACGCNLLAKAGG